MLSRKAWKSYLPAVLRYNRREEIVVEEPTGQVDSFAEQKAEPAAACSEASPVEARKRTESSGPPEDCGATCVGDLGHFQVGRTPAPMTNREDDGDGPIFAATKHGVDVRLSRDPHPGTDSYLVIEAPGLLVLFPKDRNEAQPSGMLPQIGPEDRSDHDDQLRNAFDALRSRVPPSVWSSSSRPKADLVTGFKSLDAQSSVRHDVAEYLAEHPAVANAVQMLFTSLAMSARADWRSVPLEFRGVAARGWFLGRWIPTFLVLDGPILRFLNSSAFRRQEGSTEFLRAVRAFFHAKDFMALRHAFAHWSFSWATDGADSEIVVTSLRPLAEIRVSRKEVDAFHILTFAVVEAIHDVFTGKRADGP